MLQDTGKIDCMQQLFFLYPWSLLSLCLSLGSHPGTNHQVMDSSQILQAYLGSGGLVPSFSEHLGTPPCRTRYIRMSVHPGIPVEYLMQTQKSSAKGPREVVGKLG